MKTIFEYKGYLGSAEVDVDDGVLHGKLLFIRDTVSYAGATVEELRSAFHAAVDDYLAACKEIGDKPDVPLKGSFNVRVGPERHRDTAIAALREHIGLNDFVCQALDASLRRARATALVADTNCEGLTVDVEGCPQEVTLDLTASAHSTRYSTGYSTHSAGAYYCIVDGDMIRIIRGDTGTGVLTGPDLELWNEPIRRAGSNYPFKFRPR